MSEEKAFCQTDISSAYNYVVNGWDNHHHAVVTPRSIPHEMHALDKESEKRGVFLNNLNREIDRVFPLMGDLRREIVRLNTEAIDKPFEELMRETYAMLNNQGPAVRNSLLTLMHIVTGGTVDVKSLMKAPPYYTFGHKALVSSARHDKYTARECEDPSKWESKLVDEARHLYFHESNIALGLTPGVFPLRVAEGSAAYIDEWTNPDIGEDSDVQWPDKEIAASIKINHALAEDLGNGSPLYNPLIDHTALFSLKFVSDGHNPKKSKYYRLTMQLFRDNEMSRPCYLRLDLQVRLDNIDNRLVLGDVATNATHHMTPGENTSSEDLWYRGQDFIWFNGNENKIPGDTKLKLPNAFMKRGRLLTSAVCYNLAEHAYHYGTAENIPTALLRIGIAKILREIGASMQYRGTITPQKERMERLHKLTTLFYDMDTSASFKTNISFKNTNFYIEHEYKRGENWTVNNQSVDAEFRIRPVIQHHNGENKQPAWMSQVYELRIGLRMCEVVTYEIIPVSINPDVVCVFTPATLECVTNWIEQMVLEWKTGQRNLV